MALFATFPVTAAGPDPLGAALCEENGEGTHTARYPTGAVKMRVVCREERGGTQVRYGWYFDDRGRQVKEEDLVPGKPEMSRITETDYDLHATEVIATRVFNGTGDLLEKSGGEASKRSGHGPATTYTDYLSLCEENPNAILHPILGHEKDPQFFTKRGCGCVAERTVKADQRPPSPAWKKAKTLDPSLPRDRLALTAMQNLADCLCPQAFPDSRLEKLCSHAAEIEEPWKP